MEKKQKVVDHSNKFTIKVILVAIFFVSLVVGLAIYIYTFPRTTIYLYNDEGVFQKKYEKYLGSTLKLNEVPEIYKKGHSFTKWSLDDMSGVQVRDGMKLENDEYHFYGHFEKNTYTVSYYIQVRGEDDKVYDYEPYYSESIVYIERFTTPTGIEESTGQLTNLLSDRVGYTFNGWSTGIDYEESIANNEDIEVFESGREYLYDYDVDLKLYAIWSKNVYDVTLNTGIRYKTYSELEAGALTEGVDYVRYVAGEDTTIYYAIDSAGNYVIQNDTIDTQDVSIKYLDEFQLALAPYQEYTLAPNTCIGQEEYDFMGWYLTNDFELDKTTRQALVVDVDKDSRIPYLRTSSGQRVIDAEYIGTVDGVDKYGFNVYSKWVRRSYEVSLTDSKKRLTSSPIKYTVYKYDDLYGKLYNTDIHLAPIMNMYLGVDEEGHALDGVTPLLASDYSFTENMTMRRYKFVGWTDGTTFEDYYSWGQEKETDPDLGVDCAYHTVYSRTTYRHTISECTTLNASWKQQYEILYRKPTGFSKYESGVYAIVGEIVYLNTLLDMERITNNATNQNDRGAFNIVKPAANQEFAGWVPQSKNTGNIKTPIAFNEVGYAFYQLTEADLSDQIDLTKYNNQFTFYSNFRTIQSS